MASLKEALLKGLAPDGGLYMPQTIRLYPPAFYKNMAGMSLREISFVVAEAFWNDDIPADLLQEIIYDSINFDMPLVKIADNRYLIELFHGPSYSFKDVGMRLMARLLGYFGGKTAQKTVNVFATVSFLIPQTTPFHPRATVPDKEESFRNPLLRKRSRSVCFFNLAQSWLQ